MKPRKKCEPRDDFDTPIEEVELPEFKRRRKIRLKYRGIRKLEPPPAAWL